MSENFESLASRGEKVIMQTYSRYPIAFDHGKGVYLWDTNGKKYLDFVAGIAVNSLGYANEKLVRAISEQAGKLIHVSNLYYTKPQIELAEKLLIRFSSATAGQRPTRRLLSFAVNMRL